MSKTVVIATNNAHKVAEITTALDFEGWEFKTLREMGVESNPEEDAGTFEGNARIKALAAREACGGCAALAETIPGLRSTPSAVRLGCIRLAIQALTETTPPTTRSFCGSCPMFPKSCERDDSCARWFSSTRTDRNRLLAALSKVVSVTRSAAARGSVTTRCSSPMLSAER